MKSRTSSCNFRVFKKDLTRFAPVWVEYSVLLLVIFYFLWNSNADITDGDYVFLGSYSNLLNAVYGFVCAVALFGYLCDPRQCNTVHAFPIRREEYFIIHLTAGFLMALVPNAVFCLVNLPLAEDASVVAVFGGMMLQFTFYFGLAVFCMFLTGRKFAGATLYALFNWLSVLLMWAVDTIYLPALPGIQLNTDVFYDFCPVVKFMMTGPNLLGLWEGTSKDQTAVYLAYAGVGFGLMVLSLILYRRRKLEYAGDFIAVKWLTPVFVVVLSVSFGCVLAAFGNIFFDQAPDFMLAIGLVTGFFTGMMLLKRTVKVFDIKSVAGAAAVLAAVFGSVFVTSLDPLDRVRYIPETGEIASIELTDYMGNSETFETKDPQVMADILLLHGEILDQDLFAHYHAYPKCCITYHLKNGQKLLRFYALSEVDARNHAYFYFSQPEFMINISTLEELLDQCVYLDISDYRDVYIPRDIHTADKEEMRPVLEAFFRECKEGKMNVYSEAMENQVYLSLCLNDGKDDHHYWICIPVSARDTLAQCAALVERLSDPNEN